MLTGLSSSVKSMETGLSLPVEYLAGLMTDGPTMVSIIKLYLSHSYVSC